MITLFIDGILNLTWGDIDPGMKTYPVPDTQNNDYSLCSEDELIPMMDYKVSLCNIPSLQLGFRKILVAHIGKRADIELLEIAKKEFYKKFPNEYTTRNQNNEEK